MGKSAFPVQWIADFPNMWEDCTRSVEWRSGSAGALQAQGRGFKSLLDHQNTQIALTGDFSFTRCAPPMRPILAFKPSFAYRSTLRSSIKPTWGTWTALASLFVKFLKLRKAGGTLPFQGPSPDLNPARPRGRSPITHPRGDRSPLGRVIILVVRDLRRHALRQVGQEVLLDYDEHVPQDGRPDL